MTQTKIKTRKTKKKTAISPREADIQRAILDWLGWKHIFHYRQNTGAFQTERGGFYRFGTPGAPDIVCVVNGRYIGIEVKRATAKPTTTQAAFGEALEKAGGQYILARCVEDVIHTLA